MDRVELARHEAERRMAEVRAAITTEVGFAPGRKYLLLLLAAGAGGFALALRRSRRKRLAAKSAGALPAPR